MQWLVSSRALEKCSSTVQLRGRPHDTCRYRYLVLTIGLLTPDLRIDAGGVGSRIDPPSCNMPACMIDGFNPAFSHVHVYAVVGDRYRTGTSRATSERHFVCFRPGVPVCRRFPATIYPHAFSFFFDLFDQITIAFPSPILWLHHFSSTRGVTHQHDHCEWTRMLHRPMKPQGQWLKAVSR